MFLARPPWADGGKLPLQQWIPSSTIYEARAGCMNLDSLDPLFVAHRFQSEVWLHFILSLESPARGRALSTISIHWFVHSELKRPRLS